MKQIINTEPKYCPLGCGETLWNSLLSDLEWKMVVYNLGQVPQFKKEDAVLSKCSKCGFMLVSG